MNYSYRPNNKDKINPYLKSINKHTLHIKGLINALTLKLNLCQSQIISELAPVTCATPQKGPYSLNKATLQKIYELPKMFINKPTIKHDEIDDAMLFSFPVVSFTPSVNGSKTCIINSYSENGTIKDLSLYQLNVYFKLKDGKYIITLHQNMFDKGTRQPIFLGRLEIGDTHNTKHEKIRSTFHTHIPFDKNLDVEFNKTLLGAIYHCKPDIFVGYQNASLETALKIAMKKFNITNDLDDAVNLKKHSVSSFLSSCCGEEWSNELLGMQKRSIHHAQIEGILKEEAFLGKPKLDIAKFINSKI